MGLNIRKRYNSTNIFKQTDKQKILTNLFLYYGLRFFMIGFSIIRLCLINIYLGVANLGLLNVMMVIAPISLFLISSCQSKSYYILYKYSLKNDFKMLNQLINEQIKCIRMYTYISLLFLGILMIISYFLVNSPGISHASACLLIFANSISTLSFAVVLPYVY